MLDLTAAYLRSGGSAGDWMAEMLSNMPGECARAAVPLRARAGEALVRVEDEAARVLFLLSGRVGSVTEQPGACNTASRAFHRPRYSGNSRPFPGARSTARR